MAPNNPQKLGKFKQSIAWWCFKDKLEPPKLIRSAKAIGFSAFEIVPEEHWARVLDAGLRISAMGGHSHNGFTEGLNRRENHAKLEQELLASIQKASEHRVPVIICLTGCRRGMSNEEGIENTAEGLRRVAKAAERAGVTLALELLNDKVDHPDYHCVHTRWGVEVCKRVDSPAVKLLYDIYHMQLMEGDIIRTIQANSGYFAHYHIAGAPGRHEPDDTQETNYRGVVSAIAATGYSGYIGHEYVPLGDPLKALRQAYKICDV